MNCPNCQTKIKGNALFCSNCGKPTEASQSRQEESLKKPSLLNTEKLKRVVSKSSMDEHFSAARDKAKVTFEKFRSPEFRKSRLVIIISGVAALALVISGITYAQIQEAQAKEILRLNSESLQAAFAVDVLENYSAPCVDVTQSVNNSVDFSKAAAQLAVTKSTSDARTAQALVRSNALYSSSYATKYENAVKAVTSKGFSELIASEKRAKIAPQEQIDQWKSSWGETVLINCGLQSAYSGHLADLNATDSAISKFNTLASSAPWYPDGWFLSPTDKNIAWKWETPKGSCSNCSYWTMSVIAKSGCASVYGQISITQGGVAVAWTNDTLGALSAGQQGILNYTSYPYRAGSQGQLTTLSCH